MTIQDVEKFIAGMWDWGILRGCFGQTRIEPTDIDGLVERKGKFLLLEAKSPGADLRMGQRITFEALRRTGVFTIIIVWGETDKPEMLELWTRQRKCEPCAADLDKLRDVIAKWYEWADNGATYE